MPSRQRKQKRARHGHLKFIVGHMIKKLNAKKHKKRMRNTNQIFPVGSLRRKCIRNLFQGWVHHLIGGGRICTLKLAGEVCKSIRKHFEMEADLFHGETERLRMHGFLKAARKRKLGTVKKAVAMSELDNMDTLLMEVADDGWCQEWCWKLLETNRLWKNLLYVLQVY